MKNQIKAGLKELEIHIKNTSFMNNKGHKPYKYKLDNQIYLEGYEKI